MPSYKRVITLIFVLFFLFGCSQSQSNSINNAKSTISKNFKYKEFAHEDRFILFALEFEKKGQKEEARELFLKLFKETMKDEYLLEYIRVSFVLKKYDEIISNVENNLENIEVYEEKILKIYILSLMRKKELDKAIVTLDGVLKKYENDANYELLGNLYLQKKEYEKAKELFEKVYKNSLTPSSLLNLTDVMYAYLGQKKEAINYLESHIKLYGCNNMICSKLLGLYQEQKDVDGIISVLKKTYYSFKDSGNHFTLDKVYKLLMYYLEKKDLNEAIKFLEESEADNNKLLSLYRNTNKLDKALELSKKLYDTTGNIDYLAQVAMLEFETAKDKKKVLKSVIKKFEAVLAVLDNHMYQNYLGYILIDFNIDIKKGMTLVNKALKKAPNNFAYLDSLAWGQYKLGQCTKAKENMKKVVDGVGLKDKEIQTHWKKIKECKQK